MSRITPENMTKLQAASTVEGVAATAVSELEEMQVAHCINEAANTGSYEAYYSKPISAELLQKLSDEGYTVKQPVPIARPGDVVIISWKDAE